MDLTHVPGILMSSFSLHFIVPSVWLPGSSHMHFYLGLRGNVLISTMVSEEPILYRFCFFFSAFPPLFLRATWEVRNGGVSSGAQNSRTASYKHDSGTVLGAEFQSEGNSECVCACACARAWDSVCACMGFSAGGAGGS